MSDDRNQGRRAIRLPAAAYREPGSSWLVTVATADRRPFFRADPSFAGATLAMLTGDAAERGIDLHLACVMPDHVHLLASVTTGDLIAAIASLKSRTTKAMRGFGYEPPLWQRSFHDEGIRGDRMFREAAQYVLASPVVAGLVTRWEEYDLIDGTLIGAP